jgi:hypothetical protein
LIYIFFKYKKHTHTHKKMQSASRKEGRKELTH